MKAAIVGGGVSGLAAAFRLLTAGLEVVLFEASPRLGGHIHTVCTNGFVVEHGADGFLVHDRDVSRLLDELSLTKHVIHQLSTASNRLVNGELHPLASGEAAAALGLAVDKSLTGKGTVSFPRGLGELIDELAKQIAAGGGDVKLETQVDRLEPANSGWNIHTTSGAFTADAVVAAAPPKTLAMLLGHLSLLYEQLFRSVRGLSSVAVALAYGDSDIRFPHSSTGFIVPDQPRDREGLKACTFSSSKFAHRAPRDAVLIRAYYRSGASILIHDDDHAWIQRAVADLTPVLEITAPEQFAWVSRWPDALYQLPKGHAQMVRRGAEALATLAPIELAGAARDGVGVSAAIASGLAAAERLRLRI